MYIHDYQTQIWPVTESRSPKDTESLESRLARGQREPKGGQQLTAEPRWEPSVKEAETLGLEYGITVWLIS